jgi:hypothetical protein
LVSAADGNLAVADIPIAVGVSFCQAFSLLLPSPLLLLPHFLLPPHLLLLPHLLLPPHLLLSFSCSIFPVADLCWGLCFSGVLLLPSSSLLQQYMLLYFLLLPVLLLLKNPLVNMWCWCLVFS